MEREIFYRSLKDFLQPRNPYAPIHGIGDTENLFDLGYIDSLNVVELILFLEETLDIEIPVERYTPRSFHSLRRIYETFSIESPELAR